MVDQRDIDALKGIIDNLQRAASGIDAIKLAYGLVGKSQADAALSAAKQEVSNLLSRKQKELDNIDPKTGKQKVHAVVSFDRETGEYWSEISTDGICIDIHTENMTVEYDKDEGYILNMKHVGVIILDDAVIDESVEVI